MTEHRNAPRIETLLKGKVLLDAGATVPCLVSNVSDTGAKISVPIYEKLPATFTLRVDEADLDVRAALIWRDEGDVGIRFVANDTAAT